MRLDARASRGRHAPVLALCTALIACTSSRAVPAHVTPGVGLHDSSPMPSCEAFVDGITRRAHVSPAARALVNQSVTLHGGTVVRWPARHGPLRVWLQLPPAAGDTLTHARANAARHGVLDWNGATEAVQLELSADSTRANLVVVWAARIAPNADAPGATPAGRSGVVRSAMTGEIGHAQVVLAFRTRSGGVATPRDLHAMAIHEVGHALGLAHTPPSVEPRSSIMAASVTTDDVTESDRQALRVWYALAPGRQCDTERETS